MPRRLPLAGLRTNAYVTQVNIGKIPHPSYYRRPKPRVMHPGELLRARIDEYRVPKSIVARHLGMSRMRLLDLLWAKVPVTPELALRIGALLDTHPSLWPIKPAGQRGQPGQPPKHTRAGSK